MRIPHQKILHVPFWKVYQCLKLCLPLVFYCIYHHFCATSPCIATQAIVTCVTSLKYRLLFACRLNGKNVPSKTRLRPELLLAADNDNARSILIWPHRYFKKNVKVRFEILQMRYRYTVIKFVCSLSTASNTGT